MSHADRWAKGRTEEGQIDTVIALFTVLRNAPTNYLTAHYKARRGVSVCKESILLISRSD
jgi:hypothetical protein